MWIGVISVGGTGLLFHPTIPCEGHKVILWVEGEVSAITRLILQRGARAAIVRACSPEE